MNIVINNIKKVFRSKKSIINIIIISIFITLVVAIKSINATTNNYLKKDIYHGYDYRKLNVMYDLSDKEYSDLELIEKSIIDTNHVQSSFSSFYAYQIANIEEYNGRLDGSIELIAANKDSVLEIIKGSNFPNDNGYYMICPENFYPDSNFSKIKNFSSKDKYIISNKIGKNFTLKYTNLISGSQYELKVKLVGLYKNQANKIDENQCFVNKKVNEKISLDNFSSDKNWSVDQYSSFITVVDDINNIDEVTNILVSKGFAVKPATFISYKYFDNIFNSINKVYKILLILFAVFLIVFCYKEYNDSYNEYKLFEVLGYNRFQILKNILIHALIELTISFIISLLLVLLSRLVVDIILFYKPMIFKKWTIIIDFNSYIYIYIFLLFVYIIIYLFSRLMRLIKND